MLVQKRTRKEATIQAVIHRTKGVVKFDFKLKFFSVMYKNSLCVICYS